MEHNSEPNKESNLPPSLRSLLNKEQFCTWFVTFISADGIAQSTASSSEVLPSSRCFQFSSPTEAHFLCHRLQVQWRRTSSLQWRIPRKQCLLSSHKRKPFTRPSIPQVFFVGLPHLPFFRTAAVTTALKIPAFPEVGGVNAICNPAFFATSSFAVKEFCVRSRRICHKKKQDEIQRDDWLSASLELFWCIFVAVRSTTNILQLILEVNSSFLFDQFKVACLHYIDHLLQRRRLRALALNSMTFWTLLSSTLKFLKDSSNRKSCCFWTSTTPMLREAEESQIPVRSRSARLRNAGIYRILQGTSTLWATCILHSGLFQFHGKNPTDSLSQFLTGASKLLQDFVTNAVHEDQTLFHSCGDIQFDVVQKLGDAYLWLKQFCRETELFLNWNTRDRLFHPLISSAPSSWAEQSICSRRVTNNVLAVNTEYAQEYSCWHCQHRCRWVCYQRPGRNPDTRKKARRSYWIDEGQLPKTIPIEDQRLRKQAVPN